MMWGDKTPGGDKTPRKGKRNGKNGFIKETTKGWQREGARKLSRTAMNNRRCKNPNEQPIHWQATLNTRKC
jgi:hypothetical protein